MKRCSHCRRELDEEMFAAHPRTRDRRQSWCPACKREGMAALRRGARVATIGALEDLVRLSIVMVDQARPRRRRLA